MATERTIKTKLVGVTKHNDEGERIQSLLEDIDSYASEGDPLELEHEMDNEYDENAIKVLYEGTHIGYIKRDLAAEIVQAVDRQCVQAKLDEITGGNDLTYGCNIILHISDEPFSRPYSPTAHFNLIPSTPTPDPRIPKLKAKVALFVPYVGIGILWAIVAILLFVKKSFVWGAICLIVTGLFAIGAVNSSSAADEMEELGAGEEAKKAKKAVIKPFFIVLIIVTVLVSAVYFILFRQGEEKRIDDWDRKAVATAMVALDQFAPETDYGPDSITDWMVIHNNDGTTTVWAPRDYGRIAIMLTDDGKDYTPYYISIDGAVKLGK